jgi:hypothetical protein
VGYGDERQAAVLVRRRREGMIMGKSSQFRGAKGGSGVLQTILNEMPSHRVYAEVFLGSGKVMRTKLAAAINIGIDLDPEQVATVAALFCDAGLTPLGAPGIRMARTWYQPSLFGEERSLYDPTAR